MNECKKIKRKENAYVQVTGKTLISMKILHLYYLIYSTQLKRNKNNQIKKIHCD